MEPHSPPLLRLLAAFTGVALGTLGRGLLAAGDAVLRRR
jgi:hypothetical protein